MMYNALSKMVRLNSFCVGCLIGLAPLPDWLGEPVFPAMESRE